MPSILTTARDLDRLRQIVGVLASHGFGEVVGRTGLGALVPGAKKRDDQSKVSLGERVRLVLQDLGPSFVKLGQIASTRPDLIPQDVLVELKKLQDDVPPETFADVRATVEAELGGTLEELFDDFAEQPLASASIAQVHRAKLRNPDGPIDVVVKVQRPTVREIVQRDVDLLHWLAHSIERSIPEMKLYNPVQMVTEFDRAITAELDFVQEADNAERFARNFDGKSYVKIPTVYRQASSKRVLTLEYLDGRKIDDAVRAGYKGEVVARLAIEVIVQMVFEDGFFHADPHPGNVFVMGEPDSPVVGLIDLGMVGRLTPQLRDRTIDLMVAAVREDYRGIADALLAIGRPTRKIDRAAYDAEVEMLAQKYLGKRLKDIDVTSMIRDLVNGVRKYGIEVPADFLMFGKALVTVEGVGKEIYPELDLFEEVKPYFLRLMRQRYSPERITQDLVRGLVRVSGAAADMPLQMQDILEDLRKGNFRLQVREPSLHDAADRLGARIFSGMVVAGLFVAASILAASHELWQASVVAGIGVAYGGAHRIAVFWTELRRRKD